MTNGPVEGEGIEPDTWFVGAHVIGGRMARSRFIPVSLALVTMLSLLSGFADSTALAASKPKVVVATGSVTCHEVTGTITLSPALRRGGTTPETMVWKLRASGCRTSKSNVKAVTGGTLAIVAHQSTNACGNLVFSRRLQPTFSWAPRSVHATTATFSGWRFVRNSAGYEGFAMPNVGGTARVTGSFAGTDHGRRSVVTLFTNLTIATFTSACESPAGLARYTVTGGTATFS